MARHASDSPLEAPPEGGLESRSDDPPEAPSDRPPNEPADPAIGQVPLWFERGLLIAIAIVASCGGVGLLLAVPGHYTLGAALGGGGVLAALLTVLAWPRRRHGHPGVERANPRYLHWPAIAMCVVALGFALGNGYKAGQHVAVGRDPGVYANTGKWLSEHGNLVLDQAGQWGTDATSELPGAYTDGQNRQEFQFNHMTAVLLAESDGVGGDGLMFRASAVLGALGLCAIFALGARIVRRPWLTLVAVIGLGLSLPELNVSRDTYSEPAVQLLLWGGLWLALLAWERRRFWPAVLAGFALGATVMGRVDAIVYLIPLPVIAAAALVATRRSVADRRRALAVVGGVTLGLVPPALLGTYDVIVRAGRYYHDLSSQIHQLWAGLAAAVVIGLLLLAVAPMLQRRPPAALVWIGDRRTGFAVASALVIVVGLFAAWVLRPAVMKGHMGAIPLVGGLQKVSGLPVDPTRSYAEYSVQWQAWYLGPITVALGIAAAGWLTARLWTRFDPAVVLALPVLGVGTALYLWNPSIVPDQIWAMRRYVPAALPLFVVLAAAAIAGLAALVARQHGPTWSRTLVAAGMAALVFFPLGVSAPVRNFTPQKDTANIVKATCAKIGPTAAVVIAPGDAPAQVYPLALRVWCDVPTAFFTKPPSPAALTALAQRWKAAGRTLWVLGSTSAAVQATVAGPAPQLVVQGGDPYELGLTIQRVPNGYAPTSIQIFVSPVPV
jgi:hypothetical protein